MPSPPPITQFPILTLPTQQVTQISPRVRLHAINTGTGAANLFSLVWNYGPRSCGGAYAPNLVVPMLMQGTKKLNADEIVDRFDSLGAFHSQSIHTAHTNFDFVSLNHFTPSLLDITFQLLTEPVFPEDQFQAILRKELARYDLAMSRTRTQASNLLTKLLVGKDHPYLLPPPRQLIENTTVEDVKSAWEKGFGTSQVDIFVSGLITPSLKEAVTTFAERLNSFLPATSYTVSKETRFLTQENTEASSKIHHISCPHAAQSSVAMAIPIPIGREHHDYIPLRMAVIALGGYFGSRLNTVIREQEGLTYGITASLVGTPEGTYIDINAECDTAHTDRVIELVKQEINRLTSTEMDADEFRRLSSHYATSLAATKETFKTIGDYYRSLITAAIPSDYFDRQQQVLHSITTEQLRRTTSLYMLPEKAIIVVAGN